MVGASKGEFHLLHSLRVTLFLNENGRGNSFWEEKKVRSSFPRLEFFYFSRLTLFYDERGKWVQLRLFWNDGNCREEEKTCEVKNGNLLSHPRKKREKNLKAVFPLKFSLRQFIPTQQSTSKALETIEETRKGFFRFDEKGVKRSRFEWGRIMHTVCGRGLPLSGNDTR